MRAGFLVLTLSLAVSAIPLNAQRTRGPELRGIPASVTSPRPDGTLRGIPASVTDPRAGFGFRGSVPFGHGRAVEPLHHRRPPVVVVPYYAYPYFYDYSVYEEPQPAAQTVQPQVIVIKDETSQSDGSSRYGEHSFEEREDLVSKQAVQPKPTSAQQPEDAGPPTTLIYRDGRKAELRNYAIVGTDLLDLTKSPVIKRIPLAQLDLDATRRQNEENGVDFYLP